MVLVLRNKHKKISTCIDSISDISYQVDDKQAMILSLKVFSLVHNIYVRYFWERLMLRILNWNGKLLSLHKVLSLPYTVALTYSRFRLNEEDMELNGNISHNFFLEKFLI